MAELVMKKLQEDLGPEKVTELTVERIYMEHAFCKVERLLDPKKQDDIDWFMKQT